MDRRRTAASRGGMDGTARPSGWSGGPGLRSRRVVLLAALLATAMGRASILAQSATAPDAWIGKRVITHYGAVLQVGGAVVEDEGRGKELARGKNQRLFRVYKVKHVNGPWLWLAAENSGAKGWVKADYVIPFDQAVDYITGQINANPGDSTRYVWRANVWKARKEYDIALGDLNEAIRLDPGDAVAYVNRGVAWSDRKDYDKAIGDYDEAIRLDPGYALAYNNRGWAWYLKKDYDKAIGDYSEAIRLDPGYALAYLNRGVAWSDKKDYDKAIGDYNEAIRLDPGYALAYLNRGWAWRTKKDYDKAIGDYNEAIRLDPGSALAYLNRGWAWYLKKDYDKAIGDYNEAIRLDPGDANAYLYRGVAWRANQDYDKAIGDYGKTIEVDGWKGENAIYATFVGHFGNRRLKRDDAARRFLDEAASKADQSAWPYPVVKYLRREIDEKALLEQATDGDKLTEARCYLGIDQALSGRLAEARENLVWVKDHGTQGFLEVPLAVAELDRLDREQEKAAAKVKEKPGGAPTIGD